MASQYSLGRLEEKHQLQQINDRLNSYVRAVHGSNEKSKNYVCSEEELNRRLDIHRKNYDKQLCELQNEVQRLVSENFLLHPFKLKFENLEIEFNQRMAVLNENLRKQNEVNTQLQIEISNKDVEIEKLKTEIHLPTSQLESVNIEIEELLKKLNYSETRLSQLENQNQQMEIELLNSQSQITFSTQNHIREVSELQSKLENSRGLVLSLEGKLDERNREEEFNIAAVQQQAKEGSAMQVKRFICEHENKMNNNLSKANMKTKAAFDRIIQLQNLCDILQNKINIQNDELYTSNNALLEVRSENESLKSLLESEQKTSKLKYNELEEKLQETQDVLTVKLWELENLQNTTHLPLQSEISNISSLIEQEEKRLGLDEDFLYNTPKTDGFSVQNGISLNQSMPIMPPCTTGPKIPLFFDDTRILNNNQALYTPNSNSKPKNELKIKTRPKTASGSRYFREATLKEKFELPEKLPIRPNSAKNGRFINTADAGEGKDHFETLFNKRKENIFDERPEVVETLHTKKSTPSSQNNFAISNDTKQMKSSRSNHLMSSATGNLSIIDVNTTSIKVMNTSNTRSEELGNCTLLQNINGKLAAVFRFPFRTKLPAESVCTVWTNASKLHNVLSPPDNFVCKQVEKWNIGPNCTTILCKPNGQAVAWKTQKLRKHTRTAQSFKNKQKKCYKQQTEPKFDETNLSKGDHYMVKTLKTKSPNRNKSQKLGCLKPSNTPSNVTSYKLSDGRRSVKLHSPSTLTSSKERHENALQWLNLNKMKIFPPNCTVKSLDVKK